MYVNQNQYCLHLRATLIISKCHLLINFANSLDLDQEFFKNLILKKKIRDDKKAGRFIFCRKQIYMVICNYSHIK